MTKRYIASIYSKWAWISMGYLLLIAWICLPEGTNIQEDILGFWGTDTLDTLTLRWYFYHPDAHFYPTQWSVYHVMPNIVDHLLGGAFLLFDYPLNDNLFWLSQLWMTTVSAHWFGYHIRGNQHPLSHWHGFIAAIGVLFSDALLREVNWGHAPQILWYPCFFSLGCLLRWHQNQQASSLRWSGLWLGISGLCYLYYFPFMSICLLPFWSVHHRQWREGLQWFGCGLLLLIPNIFWLSIQAPQMFTLPKIPLIEGQSITALHSSSLFNIFIESPVDIGTTIPVSWILIFVLGGWHCYREKRNIFGMGAGASLIGFTLIMGTHTPLWSLLELVPPFQRLFWPERWSIVLWMGMLLWAVHLPLRYWSALLLLSYSIESYARSENLPLHVEQNPWTCLRSLQGSKGAILEIPIQKGDRLYNQAGLRQRIHQRPLVNPLILPPFIQPPNEWEAFRHSEWIRAIDGEIPLKIEHLQEAHSNNVQFILMDRQLLAQELQEELRTHLRPILGEPIQLGCAELWFTGTPQTIVPSNPKMNTVSTQDVVHSTQQPLRRP